jgi:hypothetical protein
VALTPAINYKTEEEAYWLAQSVIFGTLIRDQGGQLGASRLTITFKRSEPAGLEDDLLAPGMWIAKIAGPEFSYVPIAELPAIETIVSTALGLIMEQTPNDITATSYVWHQYHENLPRDKTGRGQKPGPAVRVTPINIVGVGAGQKLPDQVAFNTTVRTASRKHWGRTAWPAPSSAQLQQDYGRWANAHVDAMAAWIDGTRDNLESSGYALGVWSQLHPAFLTCVSIGADDIPDIVRRRRLKRVGHRSVLS